MKSIIYAAFISFLLLISANAEGQNGHIYTVAGVLTGGGYMGDGGPANEAQLYAPIAICLDAHNNLYIADFSNSRVRKVDAVTHIITTVAGNGVMAYTGDGGPATDASIHFPHGVCCDAAGNLYIADYGNDVVRMVSPTGIISTFAGTGTLGYSGDGGPATAARLSNIMSVASDAFGNVYLGDVSNHVIRKVDAYGIITTIAGGGSTNFVTGGAPATSIDLTNITQMICDAAGNLYCQDGGGQFALKITPSGLVYNAMGFDTAVAPYIFAVCPDFAGNIYISEQSNSIRKIDGITHANTLFASTGGIGVLPFSEGVPATNYLLTDNRGIVADNLGNIYVADYSVNKVFIVTSFHTTFSAGSFSINVNEACSGPQLNVQINSYLPGMTVKTWFGDGSADTATPVPTYGTLASTSFTHSYIHPGNYSLKTVLSNGTSVVDSLNYTYEFKHCNTFSVRYYNDVNGNCIFDKGTDPLIALPSLTEVDSNGIPVDTISATSGFYYTAYGAPGDVYSFKVISSPGSMNPICPSSGIIRDTLQSVTYNTGTKYLGFGCTSLSSFDLQVNSIVPVSGMNDQWGNVYVNNNGCLSSNGTVTLHFSPKYIYTGNAIPVPTTASGNTLTWNIASIAPTVSAPLSLYFSLLCNPLTGFVPSGDTVQEHTDISPVTGDTHPANNNCVEYETVHASCDPNEMWVSPAGCLASGLTPNQLQYTINFENTGTDTAFNIYILDTLSANVDPRSVRIILSSAAMNMYQINDGVYNIIKFDLPGIKLLDSTHHGKCTGAVIYTVNTKPSLAPGTTINNRAGIYFDYNGAVMTNNVENIIGCSPGLLNVATNGTIADKVEIYPNPVLSEITITTDVDAYSSLRITNDVGQLMHEQALSQPRTTINLNLLPAGLYFITLRGSNGVVTRKFERL